MSNINTLLIIDLDGVLISWTGYQRVNRNALNNCIQTLSDWQTQGDVLVLTNRSAQEIQPIAYFMDIQNGIWMTEKGGVILYPDKHKIEVDKKWEIYVEDYVPKLRKILEQELNLSFFSTNKRGLSFYPGMGWLLTLISYVDRDEATKFVVDKIKPVLRKFRLDRLFKVHIGKTIMIEPTNLNKQGALKFLFNQMNQNKYKRIFFIADRESDISAGQEVLKNNGIVAAVGNADEKYKKFVITSGGIIAPSITTHHTSVTYLLHKFMDLI